MKELSLHHINSKSPYRVICSDKGDYLFATDKGLKREIVSCKSQIKLVIKQHIFKAFALTGRRRTTP